VSGPRRSGFCSNGDEGKHWPPNAGAGAGTEAGPLAAVHKLQPVYGHFVFALRIGLLYGNFQLLNLHRNCCACNYLLLIYANFGVALKGNYSKSWSDNGNADHGYENGRNESSWFNLWYTGHTRVLTEI